MLLACNESSETKKEAATEEYASEEQNNVVHQVVDVGADAAAKLVEEGKVNILDVRTPGEFSNGHIANAVNHNIHDEAFAEKVKSLDHSKPYLVHCAAGAPGGRSWKAVEALKGAGVKTIYHLDGGIVAWQNAGNNVVK